MELTRRAFMEWARRRKSRLIILLAITGVGTFYLTRDRAEANTLQAFLKPVEPLQIDTPPPARPAAGWPFQQLPLVTKLELPAPRITVPEFSPMTVAMRPPERVPVPSSPRLPGQVAPLWLLAPLAAGAAVGGAEGVGSVVPEPATMVLLSTGLAMLGAARRRRRRP